MRAAQLAILLEISGSPKPGCVHRTADFKETKYEHFLASTAAVGPVFKKQAELGFKAGSGSISLNELKIGAHIKEGVYETIRWQTGGNTNLGTLLLFMPLIAAAGKSLGEEKEFESKKLRDNLRMVIHSTTVQDALDFIDAIKLAAPGGLSKIQYLDVYEDSTKSEILKMNTTLYVLMAISAPYDRISEEWITDLRITFEVGCPTFIKAYKETKNINTATIETFLTILANYPDTLIARKVGREKAMEVSNEAKKILRTGVLSKEGFQKLQDFDKSLRTQNNKLNPGTTADLTASSLLVAILLSFRP